MSHSRLLCLLGALLLASCGDKPAESIPPGPTVNAAPLQAAAPAPVVPASAVDVPAPPVRSSADRVAPAIVPPVVRDGVRYAQAEDGRSVGLDQVGGVLVASDVASRKRLWTLAVYGQTLDPKLEADVQWVFFKSMAFEPDGRLRIVNEAGKTFFVDVQARTVTPAR